MIPTIIFTDADQWYDYAEKLTATDDFLELLNETIDKVKLNEDFGETSGFVDSLLSLQDFLIAEKRFDELINIGEKLKTKHQDYYKNHCLQYIESELLQYYLYIGDEAKAKAAFELLAQNPLADPDIFLVSVQQVLLYNKGEWVVDAAKKSFHVIHTSEEIIGDGRLVGIHILNDAIQNAFQQYQTNGNCDWETLNKDLKQYFYQIKQEQSDIIKAFEFDYHNSTLSPKEKRHTIATAFSKYMLIEKKMSFVTSNFLFSELEEYWGEYNKKPPFHIDVNTFDQFCGSAYSFMNPYHSEGNARLWGAQYVYDFLYKTEIINRAQYNSANQVINSLKKAVTEDLQDYAWKYGFYRYWEKADGESAADYEAYIQHAQDSFQKVVITERKPFDIDNIMNGLVEEVSENMRANNTPQKEMKKIEVRTTPKIGRNEPCPCGSGRKYKNCCGK